VYIGDNSKLFLESAEPRRALRPTAKTTVPTLCTPLAAERPLRPYRGFQPAKPLKLKRCVMNITLNSEVTAEEPRETYHKTNQHEALTLDTVVPEAARELEKTVAQTREAYERSKDALEAALETVERSYDALGQGAAALNRKIVEIAQRNINSGFDLAKSLATAKTLAEIVELRATYWRKQFTVLAAQADEVRALYAKVADEMTGSIKEHVTRTLDELRKAN